MCRGRRRNLRERRAVRGSGHRFRLVVRLVKCSDTKEGRSYPSTAVLSLDGLEYRGFARESSGTPETD